MTELPLVTIVVPAFNAARYLRESLDSIVAQTYPNMEVLVFDDASTDDTPAILASYGGAVHHHRQPRNQGIYANVNDGIVAARGELIAVYHADDVYLPTIVEREVEFLTRHPEAGAVFCADIFIDAEGQEYARLRLPPEVRGGRPLAFPVILNGLMKYKNRFLVCPTAMVRVSVYREVGPYRAERFRIASDLDMWLRIARRHPIGIIEDHLIRYRHFHGNATQQYYHLRREPERHFEIIDLCLDEGGRELVAPESAAAHEAHRAEDGLMLVVNHYIRGDLPEARRVLGTVRPQRLAGSPMVQRSRLLPLYLALEALCRVPRITFVADAFYRRWHVKGAGPREARTNAPPLPPAGPC